MSLRACVVWLTAMTVSPVAIAQNHADVPVTIKELQVDDALRQFQNFQDRLGQYQHQISQSRAVAQDTGDILEDLRRTATPENDFNEGPILTAVTGYVGDVLAKQVELIDFLESQRYRITYYASKMASSVQPEELALLFGTEETNQNAITDLAVKRDQAQEAIADFVDALPEGMVDPQTFRARTDMPRQTQQKLIQLLQNYQIARSGLELAKNRLKLVRSADRNSVQAGEAISQVNADLVIGQMFAALDGVRLQMSIDLMYLENLLDRYARSARTQEILDAFQQLVEMQGSIEGPSPELSSVLDWLQDSSARRVSLGAQGLRRPGLEIPSSTDLLREAYLGARGRARQ